MLLYCLHLLRSFNRTIPSSTMRSTILLLSTLANGLPALCLISASCNNMPEKAAAYPDQQYGYNICNATTENQSSLCQTAFINGIHDFCLWGPPDPTADEPLTDTEQQKTVAWCTKPGHGTRVIPHGALSAVRYIKTPSYVEVYGFLWVNKYTSNMTWINYMGNPYRAGITAQFDPRGEDGQGNPIGGLVFSNAFASNNGNLDQYIQAIEWDSMIGQQIFYLRACDPGVAGSEQYCTRWDNDHLSWWRSIFAISGANTTLVANFISCLGDSRPLGLVVEQNTTTTLTYTGQVLPSYYTFASPAISICTTYSSAELYGATTITPGAYACSSSPTSNHSSTIRVAAIVGSIVGVLGLIGIVSAITVLRRRRRSTDAGVPETTRRSLSLDYMPLSRVIDGHFPPGYAAMQTEGNLAGSSTPPPVLPIRESVIQQDDELGRWAAENRSSVPYELEERLRAAQYLPSDNPDEISQDVWRDRHGVSQFELKRLQEIYARRSTPIKARFQDVSASS